MKIVTVLCALLLLALCCVPVVSAGGMVKFHVSPIPDPKVGDTVTATIYNDNNLAPREGDVVLMLDWNPEVMRYVSSTVEQGHTTASDPIGTHNLEIRSADSANGLPNGDGALATVTFKIVGPGFTPIVVDIRSVHDSTGADITSRAVAVNGAVKATGTATTTAPTTAPTTVATTVASATMPVPVLTISPPLPVTVIATPEAVVTVEPALVAPVDLLPDPSPGVLPTVKSAGSARSRFGTRTYIIGTLPKNPPTGIAGGSGRAVGVGTRSTRIGTGFTTGTIPPRSRFVRWSPVTRWRGASAY
jgi:hypothetical protein